MTGNHFLRSSRKLFYLMFVSIAMLDFVFIIFHIERKSSICFLDDTRLFHICS